MGDAPTIGLKEALVESAIGLDAADAAAKLQERLSRKLFWGQADIFLIGEKLSEHGIGDPLEFLSKSRQPRGRANLYISMGKTNELLEWQPNIERNSAEVLREMAIIQTGLNITLLETIVSLSGEAHSAIIPVVMMKQSGNKKSPLITGAASFKHLKMIQLYSIKTTRGLLWMLNEIKEATITAKLDDQPGYASLNVFRSESSLTPIVEDGKWKIRFKLDASGNLTQNTTKLNVSRTQDVKVLEAALTSMIQEQMESAVRLAKRSNNDVLGFAEQFQHRYPKLWKEQKKNWDTLFPKIEVLYQIKLRIWGIGLTEKNNYLFEEETP